MSLGESVRDAEGGFVLERITITDRVPECSNVPCATSCGVQQIISGVLADLLGSIIRAQEGARQFRDTLEEAGYVIVPREPTGEMLEAAWADALSEDAAAVWRSMIESTPR